MLPENIRAFEWDERKNEKLKKERGISFEDVLKAIAEGKILDFMKDRREEKYPDQYLLLVELKNYPWVVPCEIRRNKLRLKTAYPCRKYKKLLEEKK